MAEGHDQTDPSDDPAIDRSADAAAWSELLARYLTGPVSSADLRRLNAGLAARPAARAEFVAFARLHGLLTEQAVADHSFGDRDPVDARETSLHDAIVRPAIRDDAEPDSDPSGLAGGEVLPTPPAWPVPARRRRSRAARFARFGWRGPAVVATVAAALGLTAWAWTRLPQPPPAAVVVAPAPPVVIAARLGAAVGARWEHDGGAMTLGRAVPESPVTLAAGWARLDFACGASVVVEAPATFRVRSASALTLTAGRLAAAVPPAGHGFAVDAPAFHVVDLGTEFGVAVDPDGRQDVQVFAGKVTVADPRPAPGAAAPAADVLGQGRGLRVAATGGPATPIAAVPAAFVRRDQFDRWAAADDDASTAADRRRAVAEQLARDPSLTLYYPMADRAGTVANRAVGTIGRFDLPVAGDAPPAWADGPFAGAGALDFDRGRQQRLFLPQCPMSRTGQMTGAVWVYARTLPGWGSIAKNWGDKGSGQFHLGLTPADGDLEVQLDGSRPDGPVLREGADHPLPTGRWVHVAFTTDGRTARLYRDGKVVDSAPSRPMEADPPVRSLAIGYKTGDDGPAPVDSVSAGFWDGRIGPLALFDRALSADEVARLATADGPPPAP